MKIQIDKCKFLKTGVELLGFDITKRNKNKPSEIILILEFPSPQTIKELRSFLGLAGYYRRFMKDHTKLAKPLTILLRGKGECMSKNLLSKIKIAFNQDAIIHYYTITQ